ncbi:MAG: CinA family protein [Geminicoccaceae bacterium]
MTFPKASLDLAGDIIAGCIAKNLRLATAESCTGGLISACLTEIAGSSAVVDRGFVVYSNQAKQDLLGVPADLIETFGAVSEDVAKAMAIGARTRASVDLAVAVTGIAGPGGGSATKPGGLVHMALCFGDRNDHASEMFPGDRQCVRQATLDAVLKQIKEAIA